MTMTDLSRLPRGSARPDPREGGKREHESTTPSPSPRAGDGRRPGWRGPTYYGRSQLKPAPFNNWMVGGYIFLAGLSGSSALLSGLADAVAPRRFAPLVRRARWLMALAPTLGSVLLVWDLHSPKRFYNMLRVAKPTSPMSIGTWILLAFSATALPASASQALSDLRPAWRDRLRPVARIAHAPAAVAGMGLSVYTASLLSATSTPTWAAAPRALAVRFAASAVAVAACALRLGERDGAARRALEATAAVALVVDLAAETTQNARFRRTGVEQAQAGGWGTAEKLVATGVGVIAPLALLGLSWWRRTRDDEEGAERLAAGAAACTLLGGLVLRVSLMAVGDESAARPEISFRFSQPRNLPRAA